MRVERISSTATPPSLAVRATPPRAARRRNATHTHRDVDDVIVSSLPAVLRLKPLGRGVPRFFSLQQELQLGATTRGHETVPLLVLWNLRLRRERHGCLKGGCLLCVSPSDIRVIHLARSNEGRKDARTRARAYTSGGCFSVAPLHPKERERVVERRYKQARFFFSNFLEVESVDMTHCINK